MVVVPILGWFGLLGERIIYKFRLAQYSFFLLNSTASSIGTNYALSTASSHSGDIFAVRTGRWITAIYSTTLATNLSASSKSLVYIIQYAMSILCSWEGLLAYRIWKTNRIVHQYKAVDRLSPVLRVVIESGAIYSVTITAALVTFVCQSPGVYVILDMVRHTSDCLTPLKFLAYSSCSCIRSHRSSPSSST